MSDAKEMYEDKKEEVVMENGKEMDYNSDEMMEALKDGLRVKEIHVSLCYTKNLGNYESMKFETGAVADISGNALVRGGLIHLWRMVKQEIRGNVKQVLKKRSLPYEDGEVGET